MNFSTILTIILSLSLFTCGKKESPTASVDNTTSGSFNQTNNSPKASCLNLNVMNVWDKSMSACYSVYNLYFSNAIKSYKSLNSLSYSEFTQIHTQVLLDLKIDGRFPNDIIKTASLNGSNANVKTVDGYEFEFSLGSIYNKDLVLEKVMNFYISNNL